MQELAVFGSNFDANQQILAIRILSVFPRLAAGEQLLCTRHRPFECYALNDCHFHTAVIENSCKPIVQESM